MHLSEQARPWNHKTERQVAAETVAMLIYRGFIPTDSMVIAQTAHALQISVSDIRDSYDRCVRGIVTPRNVEVRDWRAEQAPMQPVGPLGAIRLPSDTRGWSKIQLDALVLIQTQGETRVTRSRQEGCIHGRVASILVQRGYAYLVRPGVIAPCLPADLVAC